MMNIMLYCGVIGKKISAIILVPQCDNAKCHPPPCAAHDVSLNILFQQFGSDHDPLDMRHDESAGSSISPMIRSDGLGKSVKQHNLFFPHFCLNTVG